MQWFSLKGIRSEIGKIRWPKKGEILKDTLISILFMGIFALFFILSDFVITLLLGLLGVIV